MSVHRNPEGFEQVQLLPYSEKAGSGAVGGSIISEGPPEYSKIFKADSTETLDQFGKYAENNFVRL